MELQEQLHTGGFDLHIFIPNQLHVAESFTGILLSLSWSNDTLPFMQPFAQVSQAA
jgi:hypothetical protein